MFWWASLPGSSVLQPQVSSNGNLRQLAAEAPTVSPCPPARVTSAKHIREDRGQWRRYRSGVPPGRLPSQKRNGASAGKDRASEFLYCKRSAPGTFQAAELAFTNTFCEQVRSVGNSQRFCRVLRPHPGRLLGHGEMQTQFASES